MGSAEALTAALATAAEAADVPVIVSVEAGSATITHVVGDPSGSTLVYFPSSYRDTGVGSMHSVGDPATRDTNESLPLQVAYMNGNYSELPRRGLVAWMSLATWPRTTALHDVRHHGRRSPLEHRAGKRTESSLTGSHFGCRGRGRRLGYAVLRILPTRRLHSSVSRPFGASIISVSSSVDACASLDAAARASASARSSIPISSRYVRVVPNCECPISPCNANTSRSLSRRNRLAKPCRRGEGRGK